MPRRTIRLSTEADERLQSAVTLRGYANPSAFLRAVMDHELKGVKQRCLGLRNDLPRAWTRSAGDLPAWASTQSLVRVGGQSGQDFVDLNSRAGCRGKGSPRHKGQTASHSIVEEHRPGDSRRVTVGVAGAREPWRTTRSGGFECGHGSRLRGRSAYHWLWLIRP
jgi:hypothetical protein